MRKGGFVQYQEYKILKGYLTFVLGKIGEPERALSLSLFLCMCVYEWYLAYHPQKHCSSTLISGWPVSFRNLPFSVSLALDC